MGKTPQPTDEERFAAWAYVGGNSGYHSDGEPADPPGDVIVLLNGLALALRWVNDLQSGMYINCVYCGHRYGPSDEVPASMADVLKEHIESCPQHPMSALKAEVERLGAMLHEAGEAHEADAAALDALETLLIAHAYTGPTDKAILEAAEAYAAARPREGKG